MPARRPRCGFRDTADGAGIHPNFKIAIPEFLALPAGSSAREIVTRHASQIAYIDVDDPGILADVDDPAAYARLLAGSGA